MNDYLNPNGGYYKIKKGPKRPNNSKVVLAVAAVIAVGGIGAFVLKGRSDKSTTNTATAPSTITTNNNSDESRSNNDAQYQAAYEEQTSIESVSTTEAKPTNLVIDSIAAKELAIDRIEVDRIQDSISQDDEKKTYELSTTEAGTYRIEFSDVPQNVQFTLYLYNANMEQLKKEYDRTNGRGITAELEANSLYYITVEQEDHTGSYTLNIGRQKPTVDITGCTKVSDSTQFTDQRNLYQYTTVEAGTYRFEFSDVPNNIQFTEYIYNSNMEQLAKEYDRTNDRGITIDLEAETTYYVVVEQEDDTGSYALNVGAQKTHIDMLDCLSVSDSTQYTDQKNYYTYIPDTTSTFQILFECSENVQFTVYIYNSYMEQLKKQYDVGNNREVIFDMDKGKQYYIVVEQEDYCGSYEFSIQQYNE